jgi:hypothetical protein
MPEHMTALFLLLSAAPGARPDSPHYRSQAAVQALNPASLSEHLKGQERASNQANIDST